MQKGRSIVGESFLIVTFTFPSESSSVEVR